MFWCVDADMFSILANSNGSVEDADLTYFCSIAQQVSL